MLTLEDKEEEEFKYEERDEIMEENSPAKDSLPLPMMQRNSTFINGTSDSEHILNEPEKEWKPIPKSEAVSEKLRLLAPMEEEEPKITPADLPVGAQSSLYSML